MKSFRKLKRQAGQEILKQILEKGGLGQLG